MSGFEPFGVMHLVAALGLAAAIAILCLPGRRLAGTRAGRVYELVLSATIVALWVAYQVYDAITASPLEGTTS
jgi:hypothetical protein